MSRRRDWAGGLLASAVALRLWPRRGRSLVRRVVVIAGGSRGLGLALADRALREGARVVLLARDIPELRRARDMLGPRASGNTRLFRCDVTSAVDIENVVARVWRAWHRIDVWINNASPLIVGPFAAQTHDDFDLMLRTNVHAIVDSTRALLPVFRRQRRGHIVNICSIGGRIGVPHMSSYCAGKFALAGLSQTLAAELAAERVTVTTVYPGVMRVGSTVQGRYKGDAEREYAWFTTTATLPGISVSAEKAAARVIEAIRHRDAEVAFPLVTSAASAGQLFFPELAATLRGLAARGFPAGNSRSPRPGAASRHWLESRLWFRPLRAVIQSERARWNQWDSTAATRTSGAPLPP